MKPEPTSAADQPIAGLVKWLTIANSVVIGAMLLVAAMYAALSAAELSAAGPAPKDKNMVVWLSLVTAVLVAVELGFVRARKKAAVVVLAVVTALFLPLQEAIGYFMNQPFSLWERVFYYPITLFAVWYMATSKRLRATFTR